MAFWKQQEQKAKENLVDEITSLLRQARQRGRCRYLSTKAPSRREWRDETEFDALYNAISSDRDTDAMIVSSRGCIDLPKTRARPCVPELDQTSTQNLLRIAGRDVGRYSIEPRLRQSQPTLVAILPLYDLFLMRLGFAESRKS